MRNATPDPRPAHPRHRRLRKQVATEVLGMLRLFHRLRVAWKLQLRRHRCIDSFCKVCGRDVCDFIAPDEVWEKVEPHIPRGHVLCYDCFCEICGRLGLPRVWILTPAP